MTSSINPAAIIDGLNVSQAQVRTQFTNAQSDVNASLGYPYVVTASTAALTGSSVLSSLAPTNVIYVALNGNDTTGDGTYYKPFASIFKANSVITSATATSPFVIYVQPGRYNETQNILLKPEVFIVGYGSTSTYITSPNNQIGPDPSFNAGSSRTGLFNLYVGGSTGINFDLAAIGTGNSCVLTLLSVFMNGGITMTGRNQNADFINWFDGYCFGNIEISNIYGNFDNMFCEGTITCDTAANTVSTQSAFQSVGAANWVITSSGSLTNTVQMNACYSIAIPSPSTMTVSNPGTSLYIDAVSLPQFESNLTISGSPTIVYISDSYGIQYTPATPGNWSPAPATVSTALDKLAATGIDKSQAANIVLSSPNGSSGVPSFRALVPNDIPKLSSNLNYYIDFSFGNDSTGDGSQQRPWQSLQHAYNSISVPAIGSPAYFYLSGEFDGADTTTITGKPNVYLFGAGIPSIPFELLISGGSTNDIVVIQNVVFSGSNAVNWVRNDATAFQMYFYNVGCDGPVVFEQQGSGVGGCFFFAYDSFILGATITAGEASFSTTEIYGPITYNDSGSNIFFGVFGGSVGTSITLKGGIIAQFAGVYSDIGYSISTTTTGSGTPALFTDSGSLPPLSSITGPAPITLLSQAPYVNYTPANPSNWPTPPTNVAGALDELAGGSGISGAQVLSYNIDTPTTGGTVTIPNNKAVEVLNPAGTLATLTVNLPGSPVDGQVISITSSHQITSLTLSGGTIINPPVSLASGTGIVFIFVTSTSTWYPL